MASLSNSRRQNREEHQNQPKYNRDMAETDKRYLSESEGTHII